MKQVIDLSDKKYENDLNNLQKLSSEIDARQSILAIMIDMGMIGHDGYNQYYNQFIEYKVKYELAKDSFIKEFILPIVDGRIINWNISFINKEIELNVEH